MKREDKNALIESLKATIEEYNQFYITDLSGLDAQQTFELRKKMFRERY